MYGIKTLNKISPVGMDAFDKTKYLCGDEIADPDGIMVRSAALHDMEFPANLKAIARAGAGVNNIPLDRCSKEGIVVFNTPGANANAVKELTILGLLLSARKVYPAMTWVQTIADQGDQVPKLVEKGKSAYTGPELLGKRLGVIGLGAIGVMVANAAVQLGMEVYGYDPYLSVDAAWGLSSAVHHAATLKEVYSGSDFLTLHLPLNASTKEMLDADAFAMMRPGVRVLNFARGELVNTEDMLAALESRQVTCYVTDFPNEKLLGHPGILAIPHLGASTPESEDNCASMAAKELMDYLENGNITHSVNFPDVSMPRSAGTRIGVLHQNIPAMISGISQVLSAEGINIENLTNKSRGEMAYTMIDVAGQVGDALADRIRAIDGVIRVLLYR